VYLLSFYLIDLNDGSIPNLCSITSLGIPDISDIFHAKTLRLSQRKVMSVSSYLGLSFELILNFLSESLGSTRTSLLSYSSTIPVFLLSTFLLVSGLVEAEPMWMPFCTVIPADAHGVMLVGVLDANVLQGRCCPRSCPPWALGLVWPCRRSAQHAIMKCSCMLESLADRPPQDTVVADIKPRYFEC
jgi:hypothetical protein